MIVDRDSQTKILKAIFGFTEDIKDADTSGGLGEWRAMLDNIEKQKEDQMQKHRKAQQQAFAQQQASTKESNLVLAH